MRIAVITDIHGNCVALDSVLADLKQHPADQMVCLGDAIQGGPQPAEVVARLRELACPVVMGNADDFLLNGDDPAAGGEQITEERSKRLNAVRDWSLTRLSEADRQFIAAFQPTVEIPLGNGRDLLCFHGSPTSYNDVLLPLASHEDFQRLLGAFVPHVMTGGHTHMQQVRRMGETFFFNPGSVGFACDQYQPEESFRFDPWADYAVLTAEDGRLSLDFRRVPFDVEALVSVYRSSGRPYGEEVVKQYGMGT